MLTKLSQNHMNQISALRIQAENGQIGYHIIYSTLASLLQSDYSYTSSDPTVLWLRGATEANAGRGSLSELIRVYSNTQAQLRYGENISNSLMQQASNEVAKNLLKNLFGEGDNGVADYAIIPDINKIAADDATAVGKIIFNRDLGDTSAEKQANSAWSGTLLFTQLTSDQSFRLMSKGEDGLKVDSLNDWRDVLYAYVSYEAGLKAARSEFISEDLKQEKTDIDILGNTFYGYVTGEKTFIDYLSTLATGSDSQGLLSAFNLINSVGVNKFLDMLMGVVLGDSIIGTTNDDNFFANAKEFFKSSVLSLETQTLNQLTLDNLIDLAENDANIRAALNALSMVSIETSPAVKEKFDLYNPIIGYGDITPEWIEDRAKALQYFYEYNKNAGLYDHPEFNFIDIATGIELKNPSILGVSKPSKHDYIFGSEDNNIDIQGGDGNDHIYGGGGDDEIYGGEGDDYLEGGHGSDELHGGNDNDKLVGMDGDNYLYGDDGNDLLLGGADKDELYGGSGNDYLNGGSGADLLDGGTGNDILVGGPNWLIAEGGEGNDIIFADPNKVSNLERVDELSGGAGNDIFYGSIGPSNIKGAEGNDIIYSANGQDIITGGDGNDIIYGYSGEDTTESTIRNNLSGGTGNDLIYGSVNSDFIEGGVGTNILEGKESVDNYIITENEGLGLGTQYIIDQDGRIQINLATLAVGTYDENIRAWYSSNNLYIIRKLGEGTDKEIISIHKIGDEKNTIYIEGWGKNGDFGLVFSEITPTNLPSFDNLSTLNNGNNIAYNQTSVNGASGNDYLSGTTGNDIIDGANGNNFINGLDGDDTLKGGDNQDIILGGVGKDKIYGGDGEDLLISSGKDTIVASSFATYLLEKYNNQVNPNATLADLTNLITNDASSHWDINFNFTKQWSEETQSYTYFFTENGVITPFLLPGINIFSDIASNTLNLTSIYSLLETDDGGALGADTVYGGLGDDFILGSGSVDNLYGDENSDHLYGRGGDDYLYGGTGKDVVYGGAGRDYISGGDDDDKLIGGYEADVIYGGEGNDNITGDLLNLFGTTAPPTSADSTRYGNDLIFGGKGEDQIWSNGGDDIIFGGTDKDYIDGGEGNDYLYGDNEDQLIDIDGKEKDDVFGGKGDDFLFGGAGNDQLYGGKDNDILYGGANDDLIKGEDGNDIIYGGDGNDIFLFGGEGNDILYGEDANDKIHGDSGDDIIFGGTGNDNLQGGQGSDLYVFSIGDGTDTIVEEVSDIASLNYQNFIYFTFNSDQIRGVIRDGYDLIIKYDQYNQDDQVIVKDYYKVRNTNNHSYLDSKGIFDQIEISEVRFEDGVVWDTAKIMEMAPPPRENELPPDPLDGVAYFIDALVTRGDITLQGKTIITYAFPANDLSNHQYYTPEQVIAVGKALNKFAEILNIQFVQSEMGSGDLKFYLDDLSSADASAAAGYASAQTGEIHLNSLIFEVSSDLGEGSNGFEVLLHEISHALGLKHPFEAPVLPELENNQNNTLMSYTSNGVNDTNLKLYDLASLQYLHGVNQNVHVGNDTYTFADKYIWDGNGIDTFNAFTLTQNVYIDLNAGGWSYIGQKSQSILDEGQTFIGYGTVIENAIGGIGDDTLISNAANNLLQGGAGKDTYIFNGNFGHDQIIDVDHNNKIIILNNGLDNLNLVLAEDTILLLNSNSSIQLDINQFESIIINGITYLKNDFIANFGGYISVNHDYFLESNQNNVVILGTGDFHIVGNDLDNKIIGNSGNNTISAGDGNDTLQGGFGNDEINGGTGDDTLIGGLGNDVLYGGLGNDQYIFKDNDGDDVIVDSDGLNKIYLNHSLSNQISLHVISDGDLTITYGENSNILIKDYFNYSEQFELVFSNNEVWSKDQIGEKLKSEIFGTSGNDVLAGEVYLKNKFIALQGDDKIIGGNKDDLIYADIVDNSDSDLKGNYTIINEDGIISLMYYEKGNDIIIGGKGNDSLFGGRGNDTYIFNRGDGVDKIYDFYTYLDNSDEMNAKVTELNWGIKLSDGVFEDFARQDGKYNRIKFQDVLKEEVLLILVGNDLEITYGMNDKIIITNFKDTMSTRYGFSESYSIAELEFSDGTIWNYKKIIDNISKVEIFGTENNDEIHSEDILNTIYAKGGNDNIITGNKGSVTYGGDGDDNISGGTGKNIIFGDSGNDNIYNYGEGSLFGGDGDDRLSGGDRSYLDGGNGYDIYNISEDSNVHGNYKITDADGLGLISLNSSVLWAYLSNNSGSMSRTLLQANYDINSGILNFTKDGQNYFSIIGLYNKSDFEKIGNLDIYIPGVRYYNMITGEFSFETSATNTKLKDLINGTYTQYNYTDSNDSISDLIHSSNISGYYNNHYIYAKDGNDTIEIMEVTSTVYGGNGNDSITLKSGDAYGGEGNDAIAINNGIAYGENGDDLIIIQAGDAYGGDGNDSITILTDASYGGDGNDVLMGSGQFYGGKGDDTLIANNDSAYMNGGEGADILQGGSGNDTYIVDELDILQLENETGGYDTIVYQYDVGNIDLANSQFEAIELFGFSDSYLLGNTANNSLIGNSGNNYLDGRTGSDYMAGGAGDDYYVVDVTDTIITDEDGNTRIIDGDQVAEDFDAGTDTIELWQDARFIGQDENGNPVLTNNYRLLEDNIENLVLKGSAKTAFGNGLDNIITSNAQDNYIDGLGGDDTYIYTKGGGTDTYSFYDDLSATNTLQIQGYNSSDVFAQKYGNSVYLSFKGTSDHIWLSNYYVADTESNTYKMDQIEFDSGTVWSSSDIDTLVNRAANNHAPTVNAAIPIITSNQGAVFSYKFASNVIIDQDAWDYLSYKITLTTKDSNGQYEPIPSWLSFDVTTQTLSGTPPSSVVGNLSFFYWGTDMYGYGTGTSFTLKVNPPNQAPTVLNPIADQSVTDAKAFNYTVPSTTFKDLDGDTLTYTATLEDGSPLPPWLTFNASTNVLSGTSPDYAGALNIKITAKDTANQTVSDIFKLTFVVQNLTVNGTSSIDTLYGASGNDTITGLAGNDVLYGQSGNDTLNGGTGNDTMYGGKGDDIFVIDSSTDIVNENANEGIDTVQSSITYSLGNNVENLTLTGTTAINGTGNALNNTLLGNSAINTLTGGAGDDYLDGGAGNDKLLGGLGNDVYVVDSTTDTITENTNEGIDTVRSSVTYTLGNNLENLTLTGTTAINATGNALNNTLIGNSAVNTLTGGAGDDYLDGGAGNDKLLGGLGNDVYVVDSTTDTITENTNEGIDTVRSSVTYTLGNNLENLTLTGTTAINATGNALNNTLIGNNEVNILNGGAGNDILDGQGGNDQFTGGTGSDTLIYQLLIASEATGGNGTDSWSDFTVGNVSTNMNADKIDFGDLLINFTGNYNTSSLDPYIKTLLSGSNTQIYIDRDGSGASYNSTLLLTLNNVNTNLNDLLNNQQVIV
ncbi:putative Ig domain-containing protein [Acinetobacter baumannii]|uniref:putative Ig domain-containing protein n=1 Tax=Acinetobacter baumannii TaxID=470 RepID=UPI000DE69B4B|nr:putative Ig domain-containing protein [Acinetobacter baumannii]MCX3006595.1 putative Ig domain-containing protein [Acinetobacter baumannii]MDA4854105.1 putative Ig domain-containing protein [Acinetobacter baumannii]SSQ46432.1 hemolysin-type calcium-binding protein [Acinetobacter baumannii]HAV4464771.1 hypothetical protein [Acinetobacter baumannii]